MGIPLELLSMLGSTILGGVMTIWSMKLKSKVQEHSMLIDRATTQAGITRRARNYKGNKDYQFTRRTIALSCIFAILILPKIMGFLAPIFGWDVAITYGWTHVTSGFWFWSEDVTKITWETVQGGVVITPLDTHTVSSIIGLYFGNSIVKNT